MSLYRNVNGELIKIADTPIINHNDLANRDAYNCHSIQSIRNLPEKLTALKNKDKEIEDKAKQISLTDNNDGTLTFKNFEGDTNDVRAGHLVDNTTIKEINGHSTLEVIGVKGTFEKEIEGEPTEITEVYDAEDIYDDIESAKGIDVEEGDNGTLIFTDYNGNKKSVQSGYLPDEQTIELLPTYSDIELTEETYEPNKYYIYSGDTFVKATGVFDPNETYYVEVDKLTAVALQTEKGILTGERIRQIITSKGGYLDSWNFQTATPTQDDLVQYAIQQIGDDLVYKELGEITEEEYNSHKYLYTKENDTYTRAQEYIQGTIYYCLNIWDKTRVINEFNKKEPDTWAWDLNSEYWSNLGFIGTVSDATNDGLHGLVTGSKDDYKGYINSNGTISVNGLPELAEQVETNETKLNGLVTNEYPETSEDAQNKTYSADYVNKHFAPLSFIGKLYLEKDTITTANIIDDKPQVDISNYLETETTNNVFDWNSTNLTFTRDLQYQVTLNETNSFTIHLYFNVSRDVELAFGARIKYSNDNGETWAYISTNQEFASNTYLAGVLNSIMFTVYTDDLTSETEFNQHDLIAIEIYKKANDTTLITTQYYCGVTLDNADVYSYLEFNYTNVKISTDQLEDNSVTYEKLSVDLQNKIDKIEVNEQNITDLQNNKQDKNIVFTNITVNSNQWVSNNDENYPYKAIITLNGIDGTMYPQLTLSLQDSTNGEIATVCDTDINTLTIYSQKEKAITIPVILIIKTLTGIDYSYEINGAGGYTMTIEEVEYTLTPNAQGGNTLTIDLGGNN